MPSKSRSRSFSKLIPALLAFFPLTAFTAPHVHPYGPNRIVTSQGEDSIYYASINTPPEFGIAKDFPVFDFSVPTNNAFLHFSIDGINDQKPYLYVFGETTDNSVINIPLGLCNDGGCSVGSGSVPNQFDTRGKVKPVKLSLSLQTICPSTSMRGCRQNGASIVMDNTQSTNMGIRLYFVASEYPNPNSLSTDAIRSEGKKIRLIPQVRGPSLKACPLDPKFFPGDGSILVDNRAFLAETSGTFPTSPSIDRLHVIGHPGSIPKNGVMYNSSQSRIVDDFDINQGGIEVSGFENSVDASSATYYEVDYGVRDSSGIITWCGINYAGDPTHAGYPIPNAFAAEIQGFLRESNCFVATASYRDGRAEGVMLLRSFRDEILSEFSVGRAFIDWYYTHGPRAADWLLERPIFRGVVLMALLPVQAAAWVALHPSALWIPFAALLILLSVVFARFGIRVKHSTAVGLLSVFTIITGGISPTEANEAGKQPYIDSLLSEVPSESYVRPADGSSPYIDSVRKKMGQAREEGSYIDELRQEIPEKESSKGYTRKLQEQLPKTKGSAIEDFRQGKQLQANKGDLNTRSAVGFKLLTGATRTYSSATAGNVQTYDTVYGNKWVPDFTLHYEYRPFTGDFLRKLGLYGSLGASFTKAQGKLAFQGSLANNTSKTQFRFISVPVNLGLIYRFNIANVIFPYVAGGPSAIGFIENRNDTKKGNRGYALGYWFSGGIAFGLDWISSKNSWDQYQATGTKHTYLTIDYTYLESLSGGLVEFTVDGVQVGLTFEI